MVQCDLAWLDGAPVVQSPRTILQAQVDKAAEMGFVALAGTELEFMVFEDTYEAAHDANYQQPDARPTSTTSTTRSSAPRASSRCCATSATRCTPPA